MTEHRVVAVQWHGPDVYELILDRANLAFEVGDCLALYNHDVEESRPYSIASGTQEDVLRFLIRRMPNGVVSSWLSERQAGDILHIDRPFGWFRPGSAEGCPIAFVATGTGIAPFLSYLRTRPDQPPAACLYGVRERKDAIDPEWLRERCPLQLATSRETCDDAYAGRVTDLLTTLPLSDRLHVYLCGLDRMIDDCTEWLEQQGVDPTQVHREVFFYAS